jgi:hypothetical protein
MEVAQATCRRSIRGSQAFVDRLTAAPAQGNRFLEREPAPDSPGWLIGEFDHHRITPHFLLEQHSLELDPDPIYLFRPHRLAGWQQSQSHCLSDFTALGVLGLTLKGVAAIPKTAAVETRKGAVSLVSVSGRSRDDLVTS